MSASVGKEKMECFGRRMYLVKQSSLLLHTATESLPRWPLELQARRARPCDAAKHHFSEFNLKMNPHTLA